MGWTYVQKDQGESVKKFFEKEFTNGKIIDCAVVGMQTAYIAYEVNTGDKKEVVALVCLLRFVPNARDGFNFGYKVLDETMGPVAYRCPERILKLLTPTDNEWANQWREKCWENLRIRKDKPKLKEGMVIGFASPLNFGEWEESIFTVVDPRRLIFTSKSYGERCKIRRSTIQRGEWKAVQPA